MEKHRAALIGSQMGSSKAKPTYAEIYSAALRMLGGRELSRKQLCEKLERRYGANPDVGLVLDDLSKGGMQDDSRFCEMFVRSKISRGQGAIRIEYELKQAGISEALIAQHLTTDDESWVDQALDVARKKMGVKNLDFSTQQKLSRFLMQRGFGSDIVRKTIQELVRERDDSLEEPF